MEQNNVLISQRVHFFLQMFTRLQQTSSTDNSKTFWANKSFGASQGHYIFSLGCIKNEIFIVLLTRVEHMACTASRSEKVS